MDKKDNQNKSKAGITFDNLRNISEINNTKLIRMSKDAERMRENIESINRTIRDMLRNIDSSQTSKETAVKVSEPEVAVPATQANNMNKQKFVNPAVRQFNKDVARPQKQEYLKTPNRPNNSRDFQRQPRTDFAHRDNRDGRENKDRAPFVPRTGNRPYENRTTNNNNYRNNNYNNTQTTNNSTFRPRTPRENVAPRNSTTPTFTPPSEQRVQKRVFDNKHKDSRKDKSFDRDSKNKHNVLRKGLIEESNIEERILRSRKPKKVKEQEVVVAAPIDHAIITTSVITVKQLSEKTGKTVVDILKQLMVLGMMSNINSTIDFATAELVASELGVVLEQKLEKTFEEKLAEEFGPQNTDEVNSTINQPRPPIVAILGHVDHGKTSLLDFIRKTHIQSTEAGGITQNITSYQINSMGRQITFIDTPGHEAFSAMRERGASVTDIAILVVAGDDGIKPQTVEAIKHIKKANIPMIVAVNKMDKQEANLERVKQQLAEHEVMPEEWGGETIVLPISALTGMGVDKLLETILLVADMQELTANPDNRALGMVIEAKLDKGKGPIATVIILNGTLSIGDTIISGVHSGKVRALLDDKGKSIKKALPSTPVSVLGLGGVPNAGDQIYAIDEKMSKNILAERKRKIQQDKVNSKAVITAEDFLAKSADSEKRILNLIVKADTQGAFEALTIILNEINNEEVKAECIHGGVGAINENDVLLAKSSNALLIGFNTKPDNKASILAEQNGIPIFISKIIYQISDMVAKKIKTMLTPIFAEKIIGHATVIRIFKISRIGTVAGCVVNDGKITKNAKIRLLRAGNKVIETTITTLQKEKQDVKDVANGMECGIKLEGHNDILLDDVMEAFIMEEIER